MSRQQGTFINMEIYFLSNSSSKHLRFIVANKTAAHSTQLIGYE